MKSDQLEGGGDVIPIFCPNSDIINSVLEIIYFFLNTVIYVLNVLPNIQTGVIVTFCS